MVQPSIESAAGQDVPFEVLDWIQPRLRTNNNICSIRLRSLHLRVQTQPVLLLLQLQLRPAPAAVCTCSSHRHLLPTATVPAPQSVQEHGQDTQVVRQTARTARIRREAGEPVRTSRAVPDDCRHAQFGTVHHLHPSFRQGGRSAERRQLCHDGNRWQSDSCYFCPLLQQSAPM